MNSRIGAALYMGLCGFSGMAIGLATGLKLDGGISEAAYALMLGANIACVASLVVATRADTNRCLRELDAWEERRLMDLCQRRREIVDAMYERASMPEARIQ